MEGFLTVRVATISSSDPLLLPSPSFECKRDYYYSSRMCILAFVVIASSIAVHAPGATSSPLIAPRPIFATPFFLDERCPVSKLLGFHFVGRQCTTKSSQRSDKNIDFDLKYKYEEVHSKDQVYWSNGL